MVLIMIMIKLIMMMAMIFQIILNFQQPIYRKHLPTAQYIITFWLTESAYDNYLLVEFKKK